MKKSDFNFHLMLYLYTQIFPSPSPPPSPSRYLAAIIIIERFEIAHEHTAAVKFMSQFRGILFAVAHISLHQCRNNN
jgi:hypothetical protein